MSLLLPPRVNPIHLHLILRLECDHTTYSEKPPGAPHRSTITTRSRGCFCFRFASCADKTLSTAHILRADRLTNFLPMSARDKASKGLANCLAASNTATPEILLPTNLARLSLHRLSSSMTFPSIHSLTCFGPCPLSKETYQSTRDDSMDDGRGFSGNLIVIIL